MSAETDREGFSKFSQVVNEANAIMNPEPILLLALQIHDEARLALLSEDAGIFSAAEAAANDGAAAFLPTKRGAPFP